MTHRRAHVWGAAIIAAGALLGVTAALWAGRPGALWRPLVIGLVSYAAGGALVLRWGLEVYGAAGALGAVALAAFAPGVLAALAAPPLLAPGGGTTLAGSFAQLAAIYALMRCLLDPALQWVVLAGLAILAVPIGAFLHGSPAALLGALAVLSLLMVVTRILTAERCELRARVAQASAVSVGLAWSVALLAYLLVVAGTVAAEGYSAAFDAPGATISQNPDARWIAGQVFRSLGLGLRPIPTPESSAWPAVLPQAALLLAALRPWRRQRRFTDAGWSAALLCLAGPLWLAWGEPGGVFMAPFAALLAGACWDVARPAWARHVATLVAVVQMAAALLLWPRYPGGVRPDAWLPMPGISFDASNRHSRPSDRGPDLQTSRDGPAAHPDCLDDFRNPAAACPIAGRILLTFRAGPAAHPDSGDHEGAP